MTDEALGYDQPHAKDQEEEIKLSLEKSCCLKYSLSNCV